MASFVANSFGLFDMMGNVWEWAADCWQPSFVSLPLDGKAAVVAECTVLTFRGGSWINTPRFVRSASRAVDTRDARYFNIGFRVMRHGLFPATG